MSLGLLLTWMTSGDELKALDGMNKSGLWLARMTSGFELRVLDPMSN